MNNITLMKNQESWRNTFQILAKILNDDSNGLITEVEHIGSTAITTIKAKPILDIQCSVESFEVIDDLKILMKSLGFNQIESIKQDHIPFRAHDDFEAGWEKRFFTGDYQGQNCNIHIRNKNNPNWMFAIQFRDYLNHHTDVANAYEQVKERLVDAGVSREDYCLIKDPVCDLIYHAIQQTLSFPKQTKTFKHVVIETPRLFLVAPDMNELNEIYHLQSDPVVMKYITGTGRTHEQVVEMLTKTMDHYKKHGFTFFSVYEKQSECFIGQGGLVYLALDDSQPEIEVGYRFMQDAWDKGYATELVKSCIDWGFHHLKLDEIVAVTHPDNFGSQHVLQKAGMVRSKDRFYFDKPVFSFVIKNPNNK